MSYEMIYKRPYNDHEDPFVYVETDAAGNIIEEPWDKGLEHRVTVNQIKIEYLKKKASAFCTDAFGLDDLFVFYMTDSRLILQKQSLKNKVRFEGSLIEYGVDSIFKSFENKKKEGLQLIGQIRYE